MSALTETYARFNVAFDYSRLQAGMRQVNTANNQLRKVDRERSRPTGLAATFAGIGGAVTAIQAGVSAVSRFTAGVRALVLEQTRLAAALDDTSQRIGINATDLQAWRLAGELAGVSAEQMDAALVRLSAGLGRSGSTADKALRALGVRTRDAQGNVRDLGEVLADAADPLSRLGVAERNARLVALLGRSGARLGPLFAQGAAGIAQARAELQRLGGGVSPEARRNLAALDDELDRASVAATSVKASLAGALAPIIRVAVDWFNRAAGAIANITRNSHVLQSGLKILLGALAIFAVATSFIWGPVLLAFAAAAVAIVGIYLAVDDLITAFEGGRSVSASFWNSIVQGVEDAINAVRRFFGLQDIAIGGRFANGGQGTTGGFSASASETESHAVKTVPKGRGATQINLTQHNQPTIHAQTNARPEDIDRHVQRAQDRANRRALDALGTAGGVNL